MKTLVLIIVGLSITLAVNAQISSADSLFLSGNYKEALTEYLDNYKEIKDNAVENNRVAYCYHRQNDLKNARKYYHLSLTQSPSQGLISVVKSRLAMVAALEGKENEGIELLNQAVNAGYMKLYELKTFNDYDNLRKNKRFEFIVDSIFKAMCPCINDPRKNEFDFWLGEWNVVTTQGHYPAGSSIVQKVSDNCLVLENWTSVTGTSGKSMNYIDPSTNKWEQTWSGSGGEINKFVNGVYDGKQMMFEFKKVVNGLENVGRFHFYNIGPNEVRQMEELSADAGKTWSTVYDLTYLRISGK